MMASDSRTQCLLPTAAARIAILLLLIGAPLAAAPVVIPGLEDENYHRLPRLVALSDAEGSFSRVNRLATDDDFREIKIVRAYQGVLTQHKVSVEKILRAARNLWHRYDELRRLDLSLNPANQSPSEFISAANVKTALEITQSQEHLLKGTYTRSGYRRLALDLILGCREYLRLAYSYGDGSATAESFRVRGGEGAWLNLANRDGGGTVSLKRLAEEAGEMVDDDVRDVNLDIIRRVAWDRAWTAPGIAPVVHDHIIRFAAERLILLKQCLFISVTTSRFTPQLPPQRTPSLSRSRRTSTSFGWRW